MGRKARRRLTYRGPVKIIETTGQWGVYAGERIVLNEGRNVRDDLGLRIRERFDPGARDALRSGEPLDEAFYVPNVRIRIKRLRSTRRQRRLVVSAVLTGLTAVAAIGLRRFAAGR